MIKRIKTAAAGTCLALLAALPFLYQRFIPGEFGGGFRLAAGLNFIAWSAVAAMLIKRMSLGMRAVEAAVELGVDKRNASVDRLVARLVHEIKRKGQAFSLNLVEKRIVSKDELSRTFERIVGMAYRLLEAESAELALYDMESGLYHSSFVLGKPFRTSAQAMLSGAVEGRGEESSKDVLVQPIAFAGSFLGSLRVALKKGATPSTGDQEIIRLLALQSGLALINAQYTEQLLKMRQASEESVKAKTGFLANLSHELRGPLGMMLNAVELVGDGLCGPVNEDQLDTLKMVRQNGEHLLELINDVLDYAKIESGRVAPSPVEISVNEILQDLTNVIRTQAENKKHKLIFKPTEEALAFRCDRRHARQMIINLLTNAVKYTPEGGTIEVWAERAPGQRVKICVKDSGVGISAADRPKVFAAFERIDNAYSLKQVGSGLGMPLTKRLAEVNQGLVDFRSTPGEGSVFWLMLQGALAQSTAIGKESAREDEAKGQGERLLVVQQADGERNLVYRYLSHVGFKPVCAADASEVSAAMASGEVKLILIDNSIGEGSWEGLLQSITKKLAGRKVPVMLFTSRAFAFDIEKYLKLGIDRCLVKPVELKKLGIICRELIDGIHSGKIIDESDLSPGKDDSKTVPPKISGLDDIVH